MSYITSRDIGLIDGWGPCESLECYTSCEFQAFLWFCGFHNYTWIKKGSSTTYGTPITY